MCRLNRILPVAVYALILACSAVATASGAGGAAESPEARPESASGDEARPADDGEVLRFTNANLPSLRPEDKVKSGDKEAAEKNAASDGASEQSEPDLDAALAGMSEKARQEAMVETRRDIARLEARVEYLNARLLAVKNPLLKRVTPSSPDEEEAVGGLPNTERLAWVTEQITLAEAALVEARDRMTSLLRR